MKLFNLVFAGLAAAGAAGHASQNLSSPSSSKSGLAISASIDAPASGIPVPYDHCGEVQELCKSVRILLEDVSAAGLITADVCDYEVQGRGLCSEHV